MLKAALVGLLTLSTAGASLAAEQPRWFADESSKPIGAKWGIPESNAVGFEVKCNGGGRVMMRPALFALKEVSPVPQILFTVDGAEYERDAELSFSELDDAWQAFAVVSRDDPLINALRRGSTVTYDFDPPQREGDAFTVSLSGSAKAIDEALEDC